MLGKRIINTATGAACTTDTVQILGDTSCVAYYKMSDATDETGSYDGTPTNVNFNVAGKFGNAGEFNGSSSVITLPSSLSDGVTTNADCISFWFNVGAEVTSSTTNNEIMSFAYSGGSTGKIALGSTAGALTSETFSVSSDITTQYTYSTTNIPAGWNHAVVQWNSGTTKWDIYINGVAHTTYTFGTNEQGKWALKFGQRSSFYYNGKLDQIRIFDRAITANEVTTLYNEVYCQPTIVPTDHFEPVIYTGNGSSQSISTLDFQPDLVWIKERNGTDHHRLQDSVRGAGNRLYSSATSAEGYASDSITSFDSNGFSLGSSAGINENTLNYVAWNFKAGGAAVSNTDGTITSQVSANQDAGFSIVSYTTQSSGTATVGHGLSSPPDMIIVKTTGVADSWRTYHSSLGAGYQIYLNLANSAGATANQWNNTAPTSSVFSLGTDNAGNYASIAYCFHSVDGMSKFGSYVGNGGNNSIVTGFRPAYVMIKGAVTSNATNWWIFDNKRNPDNPLGKGLLANSSSAEQAQATYLDFNSNGFTWLSGSGEFNSSGDTFIFMAFAEENVQPQPELANSFNTVTYTGTGTTGGNTLPVTGFGFQPDLVWIKNRDVAVNHYLYDSVRGTGAAKALHSNATSSESTASVYAVNGGVSSFLSDGFTAYRGTDNTYQGTNMNGQDYVAWAWKASNESTINQEGSITSIVSANPASGFSIVKYQANATQGATIGHGLSSPPEMIITKEFTGPRVWCVYHKDLTSSDYYLELNTSNSELNSLGTAYAGVPNSSTYSVGNSSVTNDPATDSYIAYCFHSIDGYQKVGSYTGGTSGIQVTTGFKPRFVLLKNTTTSGDGWCIFDTIRSGETKQDDILFPNLSNAESVNNANVYINVNSTGFTVANTFAISNGSGNTYIYLAIA